MAAPTVATVHDHGLLQNLADSPAAATRVPRRPTHPLALAHQVRMVGQKAVVVLPWMARIVPEKMMTASNAGLVLLVLPRNATEKNATLD